MINFPLERLRYREPGRSDYIIVGQQPQSNNPDNPLSTENKIWSGARLARMAGITGEQFESHFKRVNVNYEAEDKFRVNDITRARAREIWSIFRPEDKVILLGTAVAKCFQGLTPSSIQTEPFSQTRISLTGMFVSVIPHPSGLNRFWNDPLNVMLISQFLRGCYEGAWPE